MTVGAGQAPADGDPGTAFGLASAIRRAYGPAAPPWLHGVARSLWLTRPDLRALCRDDRALFDFWLLMNGGREYRALAGLDAAIPDEAFLRPARGDGPEGAPDPASFPALLRALRPDLAAAFDPTTGEGRRGFAWWLLSAGGRESPLLRRAAAVLLRDLHLAPAEWALPGVRPTPTRLMALVLGMREDLAAAFDVGTAEGQQAFVWWYFAPGLAELGSAHVATAEQHAVLNEPEPGLPLDGILPITRLMMRVWDTRADLRRLFDPADPAGRAGFLEWYVSRGVVEANTAALIDGRQEDALFAPAPGGTEPYVLRAVWATDSDLRARYPDPSGPDLAAWAREEGAARHPLLARLAERSGWTAPGPAVRRRRDRQPFGVNLIGYARGQFGIGEDVRMAAQALRAAGIPFGVYNVEPARAMDQGDRSLDAVLDERLPYALNLLCMTGMETARLAAVEGGRLFDGRRTIGFWPWELPVWPEAWRHAYDLVDEVWASSRYTYGAYAANCPKTLRHMPMAVTVDATAGLRRRHFGLPDDRFLFVFSFDAVSSPARKNPHAGVRAFRTAFPRGDEPVGLVVKAMRARSDGPVWRELVDEARSDGRITVIDGTLDRGAVLDLYRAGDAYLSLHRAEGFGRGIAEAMMLGKPAIVTGFSGNLDFTTPATAALVAHRPRPVAPGEYPWGEGQSWAEPDVEHAAWWMRRLVAEEAVRRRLSAQGRVLAATAYDPITVGGEYAAVLHA